MAMELGNPDLHEKLQELEHEFQVSRSVPARKVT
jgi:hypothetical protein